MEPGTNRSVNLLPLMHMLHRLLATPHNTAATVVMMEEGPRDRCTMQGMRMIVAKHVTIPHTTPVVMILGVLLMIMGKEDTHVTLEVVIKELDLTVTTPLIHHHLQETDKVIQCHHQGQKIHIEEMHPTEVRLGLRILHLTNSQTRIIEVALGVVPSHVVLIQRLLLIMMDTNVHMVAEVAMAATQATTTTVGQVLVQVQ